MNECSENRRRPFIPYNQATKVLQPRIGALDNPPVLVASQLAPILVCRDRAVGAGRDDRFNAPLDQLGEDRVAVVGPITDQPPGHAALASADPAAHPLEHWL